MGFDIKAGLRALLAEADKDDAATTAVAAAQTAPPAQAAPNQQETTPPANPPAQNQPTTGPNGMPVSQTPILSAPTNGVTPQDNAAAQPQEPPPADAPVTMAQMQQMMAQMRQAPAPALPTVPAASGQLTAQQAQIDPGAPLIGMSHQEIAEMWEKNPEKINQMFANVEI